MIEDDMVESGHDSITEQLQCRVDNYKRNEILKKRNSTPANDTSIDPENKKKRLDLYGCIVYESVPVNMDTQIKIKKEIQEMFKEIDRNEKLVKALISDTFVSQRSDITSGKDMQVLKEEWPYLFSFVCMRKHFKLLTGVNINEAFVEAMTTKLARVLDYFQSLPIEKSAIGAKDRAEIQASDGPSGAVLMLLSYFKENHTKMFHIVDKTCIADEVGTEHFPPTPCIIVCGTSPIYAAAFMVAADQEVIIDNLMSFTDALLDGFSGTLSVIDGMSWQMEVKAGIPEIAEVSTGFSFTIGVESSYGQEHTEERTESVSSEIDK
ncbi:hypothetical protein E1301_Tti021443 [Triplophysa tibetana]|uniref:Uncharacterized protein n=1 Tax=Triplophysa tibetana TaxID=1572043 RepID=A0A5A9PKP6_9TELE|nr:hypothetical protein E1301_Tti021443 [Triplophysa tibetana]